MSRQRLISLRSNRH